MFCPSTGFVFPGAPIECYSWRKETKVSKSYLLVSSIIGLARWMRLRNTFEHHWLAQHSFLSGPKGGGRGLLHERVQHVRKPRLQTQA